MNDDGDLQLEPFTRAEICERIRGGEEETDVCEQILVLTGRARGGYDLRIGEALARLREAEGERLAHLGYSFADYAREVLGLKRRDAENHAHLAEELRSRPLLRDALLAGRIFYRAAQVLLPVAKGDAEASWVDLAQRKSVRALEIAVRAAVRAHEEEEEYVRLHAAMRPEERAVVDEALEVADQLTPGRSRAQRLEGMAQEFLAEAAAVVEEPEDVRLGRAFRVPRPRPDTSARDQAMEEENDRWSHLPSIPALAAPTVDFSKLTRAEDIDAELRKLVKERDRRDRYMGFAAATLKEGRVFELMGFSSFRQYCWERLGLSPRTVEQRAKLERETWDRPALREARAAGLGFMKLQLLSRLRDHCISRWAERARSLTCIALMRELEAEEDRHLRAHRRLEVAMPRSTALVLAAAIAAVQKLSDTVVTDGKCLAVIAQHFLDVWKPHVKRPRTRSQRVRARDVYCQVPGCSRRCMHAHHKKFRSQGGGDELSNQMGVCAYHHLRCIHTGYLRLDLTDPEKPVWLLKGTVFTGRPP